MGPSNSISRSSSRRRSRNNTFKYNLLDLTAKNVQIYFYGDKNNPYEVALIFEYPKTEHNTVNPKIGLCLESFAVGKRPREPSPAARPRNGGTGEEAPPPVAF